MDETKSNRNLHINTLQLVDSWNGNDPRWWHRDGGEPHQGIYWIDRFREPAQDICTIARREDYFDLIPGNYHLVWDAHLIFSERACERADEGYAAMVCQASPIARHTISETYVCANRDNLIYRLGIQMRFSLSSRETAVDFPFQAFNDDNSRRSGATNIKEVIIYKMELYREG